MCEESRFQIRWPGYICLAAVLLFTAVSAYSFGPTGHRVVGRIAENHLTPEAKKALTAIMGAESLARAATWPDDIRSDPAYNSTSPWHFVTIEDGQKYEPTAEALKKGDVIEAIGRFMLQLKDKSTSREDKILAIRWLVHLVGDVHQPLHVGRGPDRGGNSIDVVWFGEKTNLHSLWDEGLIVSTKLSYSELAEFIDTVPADQVRAWQNSTVNDWARESVEYRARVYEVPEPDFKGSYKYAYKNVPLVEQRLVQAGVRLAGVLNSIFACPPDAEDKKP